MDIQDLTRSVKKRLANVTFEVGALGYALMTRSPTWRSHCADLVDQANVQPGHRVLDLGCGPGISAFGMLDRVPDAHVVGLDLSHTMLFLAELWRKREPNGHHVEFIRADATQLPFEDHSFDAVTGHSFLYLLPDAEAVLREVKRVLRPGSRCAFLEPNVNTFDTLVPPEILSKTLKDPRFVLAMTGWRLYSRTYGRFDEDRFRSVFGSAGLNLIRCETTLSGLGLFGIAEA
ncbi:MAG TPA: methyltransferase domain-containing protein [Polyangium sp.]|nr:methyltransferase domain-containing protein [Polyangium sp.]